MKPSTYFQLICMLGMILFFISSCTPTEATHFGAADAAIQGGWQFSEEVDTNFSASYNYFFNDGWVWFDGYPPRSWSGNYEFVDSSDSRITLQLTNLKEEGDLVEDRLITIEINADGTLMIDGKGPFVSAED